MSFAAWTGDTGAAAAGAAGAVAAAAGTAGGKSHGRTAVVVTGDGEDSEAAEET